VVVATDTLKLSSYSQFLMDYQMIHFLKQ